jgi:PKD domain
LSSATAVVILIVVLVVAGLGSFFVFNTQTPSTKCVPSTAPGCSTTNTHDVTVLAPFTAAQTGQSIPFTVQLPEISGHYEVNFGDGTNATGSTQTFTHTYQYAGTYIVSAKALVGSTWHDNLHSLLVVTISPSFTADINGTLPSVRGAILSNTSTSSAPTGVLSTGGKLDVQGVYTGNASAAGWVYIPPTITASCGTSCITTTPITINGQPGVQASVSFDTAGVYTVTFNAGSQLGTQTTSQNYVWTAYVSSPSGASVGAVSGTSPHPGTFIVYENAPGGATTTDPSIDYETVGYEVIEAVYEPLVTYNGSAAGPSPNDFVPVVAACVPGTTQCGSLFGGDDLYSGYNWTFVISSAPQFYNPAHPSDSWGIWPSDVVFSEARSMTLANPLGDFPGWIQAQALLASPSSSGYDNGFHYPMNNTPYNILKSMTINESGACPTAAMTDTALYHGCVTFHADGWGAYAAQPGAGPLSWSNFLDFMAIQSSGAIQSCGWETSIGAGLPGFAEPLHGDGDGPCQVTAAVTNPGTAQAPAIADSAWDFMLNDFFANYPCGNSPTGCQAMVGSGPYYLNSYVVATSYGLKANPNYHANPNCGWTYVQGVEACFPQPGTYASTVDTTWESDPSLTAGLQGMQAGVVDFAGYHGSTQTALALQFVAQHKATLTIGPTLSVDFWPFNFAFNMTALAAYPTGPVTVPEDWFSILGVRQLFSTSYDYTTVQSTLNTVDGIQYAFNYGGMIPHFMSDYFPTNISWPSADPVANYSSTLSPSYWWAALTNPHFAGGQYYNAVVAACSPTNPCQVPLFLQTGAPNLDQSGALLAQNLLTYTNKSVILHTLDINFAQLVANSLDSYAYGGPMPFYRLGWAADYAAPDDYWIPMYYANSTYTGADTDWQQMNAPAFNAPYCSTNPVTYIVAVNETCQGAAYDAMNQLFVDTYAAGVSHAQQLLLYNMGEHIAKNLALYIYTFQDNNVWMEAPWINGGSIDQQVALAGGGALAFWWLNYQGDVPAVAPS